MKKLIAISLFILFFFLFAVSVMAENYAGASAPLAYLSFISTDEEQNIKEKKYEMVIKSVLNRYDSPMVSDSDAFVKTCIKYEIDCYLLPSIAGLESTFGKFVLPDSHNAFGWARGYMMFDSWAEGIDTVGAGLRKGYLNKGALSVEDIGPIYSESPTWATRVNYFRNQFIKEEEKMMLLSNQFLVQL